MALPESNLYSFDDCSILNLCEIYIPKSHQFLVNNKERIYCNNYNKLNSLLQWLRVKCISPYKFIPSENFEKNLFRVAEELLEHNQINITFFGDVFRKEIIEQLKSFYKKLVDFRDIQKTDKFFHVKDFLTKMRGY